ncbi:MAG: peptidase domain-containing ABC transporter, partial [Halothece sp.]
MVANLTVISPEVLEQALGHLFTEQELRKFSPRIKSLNSPKGKFWESQNSEAVVYILLAGKVRLTNSTGELITTLEAGDSFGHSTFFSDQPFQPYAAKATRKFQPQLLCIPAELLLSLVREYPQIQEHLYQQAQQLNALILKEDDLVEIEKTQDEGLINESSPTLELPEDSKKIRLAYFPKPTRRIIHFFQRVIRRYPVVMQQSASDCGVACVVMIALYYGKKHSIYRLRDIANVDRNGASLRGLTAAAESIGFSTHPVKASLDKLAQQSLPAIAHWEGKHYVVVYEITAKEVIIVDPAIGQKTFTHAEFEAGWTHYTLLLQPTALFKEAEEASTPLWQFFELVKPHGVILLEVFIASVFIQIFGLITPIFTQILIDRVVQHQSTLTLTTVGLGMILFGLFRVAMTGLRQYLLDHTAHKVDLALIVGFIRHTLSLPLSFFESRYVGDIISRVQENRKIQRFLTGEALSILLDLLTVFVYVGLMFWYSWKMALLALVIVPPFVLLALISTPFLRRISREIFNAFAVENSNLIEALTGVRTVKSMAVEQTVRWRWEEHLLKSIHKSFSGQVISNRLQIFSATIETLVTTGLLWFGAWLVIQGELTPGQLIAFNMLIGNVINPFQRLAVLWNELQEVTIAIERINDVIDSEPEEDLQYQIRQSLPEIKGHIRFEQVTFRYHPESDTNVLENLDFEIQPGQTVALVGRSGSGKTTIS